MRAVYDHFVAHFVLSILIIHGYNLKTGALIEHDVFVSGVIVLVTPALS